MSNLYPDILFHFTSRDSLYGILEETFRVSFAQERITGGKKSVAFTVPMVSFCDLRLSELKVHLSKYGNYGIGLSKTWANKKGLNPVFYVNKHCEYASNFISAAKRHISKMQSDSETNLGKYQSDSDSYMDILNICKYIKNYEGDLVRKLGSTTRGYCFADEREWRYVPSPGEANISFVSPDKNSIDDMGAHISDRVVPPHLGFEPEDIRYLIIERDEERLPLIQHLETVKCRYSESTRRRLASRILTSEQINKDV